MSTTDHTPATAAGDVASLAERWERQSAEYLSDWQDYDSHDGQERRGQGIALGDAASELRAALAAAPAEPVWPDDIGAVLRDLRDDLKAFRVQCRDDGETLRAVGVGDALDMLAGRIAKHPRRSVSLDDAHTETETTTQYVVMTTRHGEPQEIAHEERERAIEIAQSWVAPEGWGPAWVECIRTVTTSRRESEWKATDQ